ncbi:MAG: hypothetical protein JWR21_2762 [Herminiimonas sp.]|nr:hypothetical protein [Herminiimonas sp.]MDB5853097.1 hypothetical protein [Herminiimonas sp.]
MPNWPAMLLAPSLALTNLSITYALVTPSCMRQSATALHAVAGVSLLLALVFTVAAWRNWRRQAATVDAAGDAAIGRERFIAVVATLVGVLSCIVIAAQWIPGWVLSPCAS